MPNITLVRSHLFETIGRSYTDKEFDELCFEFGVEVDDVMTEIVEFTADGSKEEHVVYVIAIPANRYDLLCMEGFARAIRIFIGLEKQPVFKRVEPVVSKSSKALDFLRLKKAPTRQMITVQASTSPIRPFVVCAVLRGVKFDKRSYKSFIDLQEKLHQNICRKRTYVAIGTHDLDTLKGPFRYRAIKPEEINFVPLTEDNGKSYNAKQLMNFYREDPSAKHLKPYTDIIYDSPVYPVLYDSTGQVLSVPPIINGKHSRIQLHTTNVFIECTATDLTKANIVLDTMITMFSQYCAEPFTAEAVDVVYEVTGKKDVTPLLSQRTCEASVKEINGTIGINITADKMCELLNRMQLGPAIVIKDGSAIEVQVPPTRSDILHAVDVIEDVAIAYGYNNIVEVIPTTLTVGQPLPINLFTDLLRAEIARGGYVEMLTHGLCSTAENFTHLRRPVGPAVSLSNPANVEYEVVRTTLLPGALKTLSYNKSISHKDGVKLFEISDVVLPTQTEVGASNARRLVGLYAGNSAGFEIVHGLVDRIMTCVQIQPEDQYAANSLTVEEITDRRRVARSDVVYFIRPASDPCFFHTMNAEVVLKSVPGGEEKVVGIMGVVHPEVLQSFDISYPCSLVELDVEALMESK
jgi:phenylalanyl-tRNA synthetase beta chain